jgi:GT2 family glycosyltransferase
MPDMRCDIVMPVWNNKEVTSRCIDSIFDNTHCDYRLIIIDNASDAPTRLYLEQLKSSRPEAVLLITNQENLGFTKAVNQGMRAASADFVCIANNDIIVSDGWLQEMMQVAQSHKDIGIVNPATNFGKKKPSNITYQQYAVQMTKGKEGRFSETASPVAFCYLIKKEVIDKIGLLDERFSPGYFEDTDYAIRARRAGYKSVFAEGAFVFHPEHTSFKKRGFNRLFKQSEEKFYQMYPRPERVLYVLKRPPAEDFGVRIREFLDKGAWVTVYVKRSVPKPRLPNHTYVRAFYFSDLFFGIKVLFKILFKKKRFTKIFWEGV